MPSSDAERRYGRQGGGWLPKDAPAPVAKDPDRVPVRTGVDTRAWTPEDWAGRARMARARRAAGRPLDHTDREAMRLHSQPEGPAT